MSAKRKYTRPSESTWAEICAFWEVGDSTLEELSERFGVARRTLQAHFAKHGVIKGCKAAAMAQSVQEEVFSRELNDHDVTVARAKATREAAYNNAIAIEALVMGQLEAAKKDPSSTHKVASAIRALSLAAAAVERLHAVKKAALGLDRDNVLEEELPTLVIQDLTAEDLAELQARDEQDEYDENDLLPFSEPTPHDSAGSYHDDEVVVEDGTEEIPGGQPPVLDHDGYRVVGRPR
ncbi:hypothetical protein [Enterovirga sp. CN4-39]|uniref:hypothetical protein n=1 Tax=Enterovirga sp. CN4-39 TaxID=3400910 RepID=UPI003C01C635